MIPAIPLVKHATETMKRIRNVAPIKKIWLNATCKAMEVTWSTLTIVLKVAFLVVMEIAVGGPSKILGYDVVSEIKAV